MSAEIPGLTDAELDQLADYTADALEPAHAEQVAHLVRTEPRWATAHRALVDADLAVRADLRTAASTPLPMPVDVVARLDAAIADATPVGALGTVISLDEARARRRRVVMAVAGAAAAVVAVVGGLSLAHQPTRDASTASAPGAGDLPRADAAAPPAGTYPAPSAVAPDQAGRTGPRVLSSGTDYQPDTLRELTLAAPTTSGDYKATEGPQAAMESAPGALSRLTTPTALAACLGAIAAGHPGTALVVDYARFEGQPALIVLVRAGESLMIVVVGPNCGLGSADEKAAIPAS